MYKKCRGCKLKSYIRERVLEIANFVVERKCTVREAGKAFCVSKSTAHKDLSERLPLLDRKLYCRVSRVLGENWAERYIRGGLATRKKYKGK